MLTFVDHFLMDVKAIRVQKLKDFVSSKGGAAAVARTHDGVDASYLSQLINGHRPFGEKSARKMERLCQLPHLYFDNLAAQQDQADYIVQQLLQKMDASTKQKWISIGHTLAESEEDNGSGPSTAAK